MNKLRLDCKLQESGRFFAIEQLPKQNLRLTWVKFVLDVCRAEIRFIQTQFSVYI